eukprot:snap_masked-scaffold_1-processed-gene-22.35-mRNA-1 protein AED:1.00 eAED:1.00 QI:0/-1/0/0/-1/1/1/0/468
MEVLQVQLLKSNEELANILAQLKRVSIAEGKDLLVRSKAKVVKLLVQKNADDTKVIERKNLISILQNDLDAFTALRMKITVAHRENEELETQYSTLLKEKADLELRASTISRHKRCQRIRLGRTLVRAVEKVMTDLRDKSRGQLETYKKRQEGRLKLMRKYYETRRRSFNEQIKALKNEILKTKQEKEIAKGFASLTKQVHGVNPGENGSNSKQTVLSKNNLQRASNRDEQLETERQEDILDARKQEINETTGASSSQKASKIEFERKLKLLNDQKEAFKKKVQQFEESNQEEIKQKNRKLHGNPKETSKKTSKTLPKKHKSTKSMGTDMKKQVATYKSKKRSVKGSKMKKILTPPPTRRVTRSVSRSLQKTIEKKMERKISLQLNGENLESSTDEGDSFALSPVSRKLENVTLQDRKNRDEELMMENSDHASNSFSPNPVKRKGAPGSRRRKKRLSSVPMYDLFEDI